MKNLSLFSACLIIFIFSTGVPDSNAQVIDLIGTWNIIEFTIISEENSETTTENKLNENGSVWDLFFMEEGKFRQTLSGNMNETGIGDSQEGTWKTSENNLTIVLQMNDQQLNYTYELKDNILVLKRSEPWGNTKIVTTFKRK